GMMGNSEMAGDARDEHSMMAAPGWVTTGTREPGLVAGRHAELAISVIDVEGLVDDPLYAVIVGEGGREIARVALDGGLGFLEIALPRAGTYRVDVYRLPMTEMEAGKGEMETMGGMEAMDR